MSQVIGGWSDTPAQRPHKHNTSTGKSELSVRDESTKEAKTKGSVCGEDATTVLVDPFSMSRQSGASQLSTPGGYLAVQSEGNFTFRYNAQIVLGPLIVIVVVGGWIVHRRRLNKRSTIQQHIENTRVVTTTESSSRSKIRVDRYYSRLEERETITRCSEL